jgi:hypothetical protein
VGTAFIQELRFNKYCERLQGLLIEEFDQEFKRYLLEKGINIDTSMFDIAFQEPQNFASYRQAELDNQRIPTFTQVQQIPFMSNRFALKRFLGLSEEEIAENERMWREENDERLDTAPTDAEGELRSVGISSAGISADIAGAEDIADIDEPIEDGGTDGGPDTATGEAFGGTEPPTDQTI